MSVRERLKRYPEPYASHYGVVPSRPPKRPIALGEAGERHLAAIEALARVDVIAAELEDPYIVSRVLPRREAVSSSAVEGTHSTLDELLLLEETADEEARGAAAQVPRARAEGPDVFTLELVQEFHRLVVRSDEAYPDPSGAFRATAVWIGGGGHGPVHLQSGASGRCCVLPVGHPRLHAGGRALARSSTSPCSAAWRWPMPISRPSTRFATAMGASDGCCFR
jgi:hypothetical protein